MQVCRDLGVHPMTKTHETPLRNVGTCSSLNQQIQSAKARYSYCCLLLVKREMATPFAAQQQIKQRRQYLHHQGKTFVALKAIAAPFGCTVYGLGNFDRISYSVIIAKQVFLKCLIFLFDLTQAMRVKLPESYIFLLLLLLFLGLFECTVENKMQIVWMRFQTF